MFAYCNNLSIINLSSFNTKNVSNFEGLFYNCNNLLNLDLSLFDTSNCVQT